jgi:sulfatase-like protein
MSPDEPIQAGSEEPEPTEPGVPDRSDAHGGPSRDSIPAPFSWYRDHRLPEPLVLPERRWSIRRDHTLDALACLALSALWFSQARDEILLRADWDFYNRIRLRASTLLALLLSILALAAVGFVVTRTMRRVQHPSSRRLAAVVAAAALVISLNFARMTHATIDGWTDAIGRPGLLAVVVLLLATSLGWPRPALRAIRGLALVVSPLAIVTLLHIAWMFLEVTAGPVWRQVDGTPLKQAAPSLRRVVWVVFDQLDQRLVFEARPAELELPELDRLRRESLYADSARPPAGSTEVSMPALITGRPVVAVAPTSPNDLELTFADGKPASWRAQPNVFTRARALGYDTALIGWHLPYSRVLGEALGIAAFRASVADEHARGETLGEAIRNQWEGLVPPIHVRRLFAQRFAELRDLAIRTATDDRFGLVLLHLPVPETPAIYDRPTGRLVVWNFAGPDHAYLDNVALADQVMADLRRGLERMRLDDRTWVVMSSSRWAPAARPEVGSMPRRVPFLVRPPDGGRTVPVDAPFSTLVTHDLVLAILRGSISDARDAATWLARWPVAPPKDYTSEGRPIY